MMLSTPARPGEPVATVPVIVIESGAKVPILNLAELRQQKDLLFFLVWRDVKVLYTQTVMGLSWAFIRPAFSMLVFSVVFGGLAKVPSDGAPYPVFSLAALVPWTYYATALTAASGSLISNANMLSKVYFPRIFIPLTPVLSGLVDFLVGLVMLAGLMLWYRVAITPAVLYLPLLLLLMVAAALSVGLWLAALAVQYRDVKHGIQFLVQLLMYAAPVVWPASLIDRKIPEWRVPVRLAYGFFQPMAGVVEGFRAALLRTTPMPWDLIGASALSSSLLLVTGLMFFRRRESVFADVA